MSNLLEKLETATSDGDLDTLKNLISKGVDLNHPISGTEGNALYHPCENGDVNMVQYLLKSGVDPEFEDDSNRTPIMAAARADNANPSAAFQVCQLLVNAGVELNKVDSFGNSVLMHAAEGGILRVVQLLVTAGADPAYVNSDGAGAINIAEDWLGENGQYKRIIAYLKSV